MIEKLKHYSITNAPSVYDEEALTALELAGRTAQKVNEVIDLSAETKLIADNCKRDLEIRMAELPAEIRMETKEQVDSYIENGTFDKAIDEYAGGLEDRVDNLLNNVPEGSTTMDAEVIDARLGGNGKLYDNIGQASREQYSEVNNAVNDRFSVKAKRYGYKKDYNRKSMWEQGWISTDTGVNGNTGTDNDVYIRTVDFIPSYVERIETLNGETDVRLSVYRYTHTGVFVDTYEHRFMQYNFDHSNYRYKIAVTGAVSTSSFWTYKTNITASDYHRIMLLGEPDISGPIVSPDAMLYGYKVNHNARYLWEQGYIYGDKGENGDNPSIDFFSYARTVNYLPSDVERIAVKTGYKARIFRYRKNGEWLDKIEVSTHSDTFDHNNYLYRMDITLSSKTSETRATANDLYDKVYMMSMSESSTSPFLADVKYAPTPNTYYRCNAELNKDFHATTSASYVVGLFDTLINSSNGYMTKQKIGEACDGQAINAYRFKPNFVHGSVVENLPKIIIMAGQHGFEKANVFGLYYLMRDVVLNWDTDPVLEYLHSHVELIVIPMVNPSGFDVSTYVNANGVNLNRNYDYKWVRVADTTSLQYGGASAFDQPETQAIRDFILSEDNISIVIDSHSMGSSSVAETKQINWFACCQETEEGYARLRHAIRDHISKQTPRFIKNYGVIVADGGSVGYYEGFEGGVNTTPSVDNWLVYNKRIVSLTLEGFNGFPNKPSHTTDCHRANAEIIGNFLLSFCSEYGKE